MRLHINNPGPCPVSQEAYAFVREEKNSVLSMKVKVLVEAWRAMLPVLTGNYTSQRWYDQ